MSGILQMHTKFWLQNFIPLQGSNYHFRRAGPERHIKRVILVPSTETHTLPSTSQKDSMNSNHKTRSVAWGNKFHKKIHRFELYLRSTLSAGPKGCYNLTFEVQWLLYIPPTST